MHSITAKQDSQSVALNATVKTLNEALLRAKLSTDAMTPGTAPGQFSKQAALDWYLAQGYISFQGTVDVDKVNFSTDTGFWEKSTTSTNSP